MEGASDALATLCATCKSLDFHKMAQPVETIKWDSYMTQLAYDTRLQVHHPSFGALLRSAEDCGLCALILEGYTHCPGQQKKFPGKGGAEYMTLVHEAEAAIDDEYTNPTKLVWQLRLSGGSGTWKQLYSECWPVAPSKWQPIKWPPPQIKTLLGAFVLQGRIVSDKTKILGLIGFSIGRIEILDSDVFISHRLDWECGWISLATTTKGLTYMAAYPLNKQPDLSAVSQWTQTCGREHSACGSDSDHELPTRVVDVGREDFQEPRLFETLGGRGRWVALSYCWGGAPPLTTAETYEKNLEALPFNDLPRLFQDAVRIVRAFGFQYLWIDTLCIIQGDKQDWERECSRMRSVYEYSALTISGPSATSPEGTLLHSRSSDPHVQFRHQDHTVTAGVSHIYASPYTGLPKQEPSTLSHRGWVLQERLLAPRILYFGEQMMYWECRTADHFEILRAPMPTDVNASGPVPKSLFNGSGESLDPGSKARSMWRKLVETYCTCDLTNPSDRLPGISGLARRMRREFSLDEKYLGGLWSGGLGKDLAWFRDPHAESKVTPANEPTYRAPSWSWAAQDLPLLFHDEPLLDDSHVVFEVVDSNIAAAGLDTYGQLVGGHLKIDAHVMTLQLYPASYRAGRDTSDSAAPGYMADYWPDRKTTARNEISTPCILLSATKYDKSFCLFTGLALDEVLDQPGMYRRLGYICNSTFDTGRKVQAETLRKWQEIERTTITIV